MIFKAGRRPRRLVIPVGAVGACQACGDLHVLTLEVAVWKHRKWTKDALGLLVRPVCPGSGRPPRAPRS